MFNTNEEIDFGEYSLDLDEEPRSEPQKRQLPVYEAPKPPKIVKRKFPGPAGIFPKDEPTNTQDVPCTQMTALLFDSPLWGEMANDFEPYIQQYDIKWIKANANLHKLPNQRAPFLAAVIASIDSYKGKDAIVNIVLKDKSGEIQGTVIQSLFEKYSDCLVSGSIIVLRQCGVLTTSFSNNQYLSITMKNLVRLYWKDEDGKIQVVKIQEMSDHGANEKKYSGNEKGSLEEEEWKDILDVVDMDSFFEDF